MDLLALHDWIAADSPANAQLFTDRLVDAASLLHEHAYMGPQVPEAGRDDVREVLFEAYRSLYLVETVRVYILGIVHGARDLANMQSKPWE